MGDFSGTLLFVEYFHGKELQVLSGFPHSGQLNKEPGLVQPTPTELCGIYSGESHVNGRSLNNIITLLPYRKRYTGEICLQCRLLLASPPKNVIATFLLAWKKIVKKHNNYKEHSFLLYSIFLSHCNIQHCSCLSSETYTHKEEHPRLY